MDALAFASNNRTKVKTEGVLSSYILGSISL